MFTYYGNHGLGDNARVPVGHFKVVKQINGTSTYLQNSKGDQLGISNFVFDNDNLYAETGDEFGGGNGSYVIWNLRTDNWTYYGTKEDYLSVAKQMNYPEPERFKDFFEQYSKYWNGWRFFLLP